MVERGNFKVWGELQKEVTKPKTSQGIWFHNP